MTSCEPCSCPCCNGRKDSSDGVALPLTVNLIVVCCLALALAFACGCTRTVLVSEASPIRTGPCVKGRVYTKTADGWQLGDNDVKIPEGWYCVPPSFVEETK
jgi:hypothetical protein